MDRERFAGIHCSIARGSGVLADPWTLLVLRDLFVGVGRYDQLRQDLGIATNVLADRLDRLIGHGLVETHTYQHKPVRVEYRLTERGRDTFAVLLSMMAWGDRNLAGSAGPPLRLRHTECGELATPTVCCDHCAKPLTSENVDYLPGPGGATAPGTALLGGWFKSG